MTDLVNVPPEFIQPILAAAQEANGAYWNDLNEQRLRQAMIKLNKLLSAVYTLDEVYND